MTGNICAPAPVEIKTTLIDCPTCEKKTEFLCEYYEWYGGEITCLNCGDSWNEEGRAPRPFERGWREKSISRAKATLEREAQNEKR